MNNYQFN